MTRHPTEARKQKLRLRYKHRLDEAIASTTEKLALLHQIKADLAVAERKKQLRAISLAAKQITIQVKPQLNEWGFDRSLARNLRNAKSST